jgi:hypothetical protein
MQAAVVLVLVAVVAGGCGSGGGATVPSRTWHVLLKSIPEMSGRRAGGTATIRLLADRRICWSFGVLDGVSHPTRAHINAGTPDAYGSVVVPLGASYTADGCTKGIDSSLATQIAFSAAAFYVDVENTRYPSIGALRAQL